jgi:hypothetical protein
MSILQWVEKLREAGELVAFKATCDPPPEGSQLAKDVFVLIIQTPYQRHVFRDVGNAFAGIDATHNTTHYENLSLFTIIVRDRWGHGMITY